MTVVQYEQPPPLPASAPGDELAAGPTGDVARLRAAAEYAGYVGDTEFVPDTLRGRPAAITAALLTGRELGLDYMAALRSIAIIKGRPTLSAEAQRGLVTSRGHELWFEESTTTRAIAAGRRAGTERIGRVTWTMDDAKRAGIAGGDNWRRYPAEMLRARASSALARAMFADVTLGIPATEELEGEPDNGPAPDAPIPATPEDAPTPPAAGRTRRRRTPAQPRREPVAPTPPPDPQPEPPTPPAPLASDAQKRQIFALMRDVGMAQGDRDDRLDYTVRVIGREISSSNELTIGEAGSVIKDLQEILKLPADQRPARIASAGGEAAVLAEVDQLAAEGVVSAPTPADPPDDPTPAPAAVDAAGGREAPRSIAENERAHQQQRLAELFEANAVGDDDERLAYARGVIPRELAELAELTADEGSTLIAHLEQYDRDDPQTWPLPDGF